MDRITLATPEGATEHNLSGQNALPRPTVVEIDHSLAEARINSVNAHPKAQAVLATALAKRRGPDPAPEAAPKRAPKRGPRQASTRQSPWQQVPPGQIRPRPGQTRRTFDPAAQADLAQSVRAHGVLQPILVRRLGAGDDTLPDGVIYEIVAGERRWRAGQEAGLAQVPVLVQQCGDGAAAEIALVENLQRADLTPLETADALARMAGQGYSVRKLATRLGRQKGWVEQHLLLARLPEDLRAMVSGRPDTLTHARELEKVTEEAVRAALIVQVLDRDSPLTLAKLRQLIKGAKDGVPNEEFQEAPCVEASTLAVEAGEEAAAAEASAQGGGQQGAGGAEADPGEDANAPVQDAPPSDALSDEAPAGPDEAAFLPEARAGTEPAIESLLHQEVMLANLRTTQKRLPSLPAPTDPARRQELVTMLTATRDAIAVTLARWGVQA